MHGLAVGCEQQVMLTSALFDYFNNTFATAHKIARMFYRMWTDADNSLL